MDRSDKLGEFQDVRSIRIWNGLHTGPNLSLHSAFNNDISTIIARTKLGILLSLNLLLIRQSNRFYHGYFS
jgi:hypothetical protein